ncbi:MAG: PDZ domain-containing protein [Elusimicrobia bacterium]|nr:PDZ domain-containing protein [Elusimicrobiota bacterium]
MKKMIPVLLASLLTARAAWAETTPVRFGGIRPVAPLDSGFSRIKYKIENGPAAEAPKTPPNLTLEQLVALAKFLMPDPEHPPKNLPPALVYRLLNVLAKVDMHYKRPIPKPEWDRRIKEMQDEFVARNGKPGAAARSTEDWEKSIDGMIGGFVQKLGDPHSVYMNREEAGRFIESMQGSFVGIGAGVEKVVGGVKLQTVYPGSPAEKAGLIGGDVVTAVDGVATQDQDIETVIGRLRGPAGTPVKVRVQRLGRPVTVVRAAIQVPDLTGKMAAPGIGYVYFSHFGCHTNEKASCIDERLFRKIDELKAAGARKLIIDLRGNGGGRLDAAESIGSEFLKDKDVVAVTKRQGQIATKAVTEGLGRYYGMPLAILVNGYSASASEVLAAGLQEHGRAIIVGSVSYGKGSFQLPMPTEVPVLMPGGRVVPRQDGTIIKVTEGGWYTPLDRSVEGVHDPATGRNVPGSGGVKPDAVVAVSDQDESAAMKSIMLQLFGRPAGAVKDAALDKAIEVLSRP